MEKFQVDQPLDVTSGLGGTRMGVVVLFSVHATWWREFDLADANKQNIIPDEISSRHPTNPCLSLNERDSRYSPRSKCIRTVDPIQDTNYANQ